LHPVTHRNFGPSDAQSSSTWQFKEQNSVSSKQPLDVAPSVSNCHVVCPMHEVPWPQVTALPVSHGVPGETPAEHDTIQMMSEVLVKAAPLAHRDPMVGW
jgi:hypothetical protein